MRAGRLVMLGANRMRQRTLSSATENRDMQLWCQGRRSRGSRGPGKGRVLLTCIGCVQAMRPLLFAALVGLSACSALGPLPSASGGRLMRVTPIPLETEPCVPVLRTQFIAGIAPTVVVFVRGQGAAKPAALSLATSLRNDVARRCARHRTTLGS